MPFGGPHLAPLQVHLIGPLARDLANLAARRLDLAVDGIVRAGEETLDLEVDVAVNVIIVVRDFGDVAELEHHLSEEDAAGVPA